MRRLVQVVLLGAVLAVGCGGQGATTVTGEVTLDGKPIEDGLITFVPVDGKTPNAATKIKGGKYSLKATPGAMRVQINSAIVTGKRKAYDTPDSPLVDVLGERIPNRYNEQTTLTLDVKPGENVKNWELQGEKKEKGP
jgi:hypothetical protein